MFAGIEVFGPQFAEKNLFISALRVLYCQGKRRKGLRVRVRVSVVRVVGLVLGLKH